MGQIPFPRPYTEEEFRQCLSEGRDPFEREKRILKRQRVMLAVLWVVAIIGMCLLLKMTVW